MRAKPHPVKFYAVEIIALKKLFYERKLKVPYLFFCIVERKIGPSSALAQILVWNSPKFRMLAPIVHCSKIPRNGNKMHVVHPHSNPRRYFLFPALVNPHAVRVNPGVVKALAVVAPYVSMRSVRSALPNRLMNVRLVACALPIGAHKYMRYLSTGKI